MDTISIPSVIFSICFIRQICSQTTVNPLNPFTFRPPSMCDSNNVPCGWGELYRRLDGSCSNPFDESWGFAGSRYIYLIPPRPEDGIFTPMRSYKGKILPEARVVKNKFFPDGNVPSNNFTLSYMTWGQLYAHDLSLLNEIEESPCCTSNGNPVPNISPKCFPVKIPKNDPEFSSEQITCLNFSRILTDSALGCPKKSKIPNPINTVTPALDLSPLYGISDFESNNLRSFEKGQLRTDNRNNISYPPSTIIESSTCSIVYETGDFRSNQNAPLLMLHMMLINNHNSIALKLSLLNPHWDDETIFQETRTIMIAIFQKITYYEWFPVLLGKDAMINYEIIFDTDDYADDFDPSINLAATNENSHAASRILHTLIPHTIDLYAENRTVLQKIPLSDNFFCQELFEQPEKVNQVAVGMITQQMGEFDTVHPKSITKELFKQRGSKFGSDLRSIDIHRARDVGLSPYIEYLQLCEIVHPHDSFGDFRDFQGIIPDEAIAELAEVYERYDAIDLSTGLGLEIPIFGTNVGPTTMCLLVDQALRSRLGDEKWFEHIEAGFSSEQLIAIKKVTFSKFFCDGANVRVVQEDAFQVPNEQWFNPFKKCSELTPLDLSFWKEDINDPSSDV